MILISLSVVLLATNLVVQDPKPTRKVARPKPVELVNLVEGRVTILSLSPEGYRVKKGDVIGELDSAGFREELLNQEITVKLAEAEAQISKTNRELAESNAKQDLAMFARDVDQAKAQLKQAETNVAQADARVAEVKKLKMTHKEQSVAASKSKADLVLKDAQLALKTMQEITGPQHVQESEIVVKQAKANEESKAAELGLHREKEKKLRLQIERCKLIAPASGFLQYANPADDRLGPPTIEEGAIVRERQALIRILPG